MGLKQQANIKIRLSTSTKRSIISSALTFFLGNGSLLLADIYIARTGQLSAVEDWAVFRSLIFPLSAVALLGLDQALVREPSKARLFAKPAAVLVFFIAAILTASTYFLGYYEDPFYLFSSVVGMSFLFILSGYFRGRLFFGAGQLARDGWKPLFLLLLVLSQITLDTRFTLVVSIFVILVSALFILASHTDTDVHEVHDEVSGLRTALGVSWPFFLTGFSLSVATYGDMLLIEALDPSSIVSDYFKAIVLFTYPVVMANTYLAGLLSSFIRQQPANALRLIMGHKWVLVTLIAALPCLSLGFGYGSSRIIFPGYDPDFVVALLLSLTAGLRFGYILVSSLVAALASKEEVTRLSYWYFLFACATPAVCVLMARVADVVVAVALTTFLHWCLRGSAGWRLSKQLWQKFA